jgi:hypothetical protein
LLFPLLTDKNNIFFSEEIFSLSSSSHTHQEKLAENQRAMRRFSAELSSIFISIFTEFFQLVSSVRPLMFA